MGYSEVDKKAINTIRVLAVSVDDVNTPPPPSMLFQAAQLGTRLRSPTLQRPECSRELMLKDSKPKTSKGLRYLT